VRCFVDKIVTCNNACDKQKLKERECKKETKICATLHPVHGRWLAPLGKQYYEIAYEIEKLLNFTTLNSAITFQEITGEITKQYLPEVSWYRIVSDILLCNGT
jgi:hypothetical protein